MLKYETLAKFVSKRSGNLYFVKKNLATGVISCNCKGWIYHQRCKHIDYLVSNQFFVEITDIPTRYEAEQMDYGRNLEEKEKWTVKHLKAVKI